MTSEMATLSMSVPTPEHAPSAADFKHVPYDVRKQLVRLAWNDACKHPTALRVKQVDGRIAVVARAETYVRLFHTRFQIYHRTATSMGIHP